MIERTRPAVFLDRDDTLNVNAELDWGLLTRGRDRLRPGDLVDPAHVELLPGALEACERLVDAGYMLIVVTNQSSVARGGSRIEEVDATNARLMDLVSRNGASLITAAYYSPHHPAGIVQPYNTAHPDRKPGPGMLLRASAEHGIDLSISWIVGDKQRDVDAGLAAGLAPSRCLLIGGAAKLGDIGAATEVILAARAAADARP